MLKATKPTVPSKNFFIYFSPVLDSLREFVAARSSNCVSNIIRFNGNNRHPIATPARNNLPPARSGGKLDSDRPRTLHRVALVKEPPAGFSCELPPGQFTMAPVIQTGSAAVATGIVKWFNATKGFGFIQPDGGGKDVFVHISAVEKAGFSGLAEGAKVSYEIVADRGKESAGNLRIG